MHFFHSLGPLYSVPVADGLLSRIGGDMQSGRLLLSGRRSFTIISLGSSERNALQVDSCNYSSFPTSPAR